VSIKISDYYMHLEINGQIIGTAIEVGQGWWRVTHWPRFFRRNQAITAPTVTELLETGYGSGDPVAMALRAELLT
jgi:hypothetical protein